MFRTRDFILFFVTIVFLVMAIGATLFNRESSNDVVLDNVPQLADVSDADFAAEVVSANSLSRDERLAAMRQKIADSSDLIISEAVSNEEVVEETDLEEEELNSVNLLTCPNFQQFAGVWPATAVVVEVVEGSRLFYTETESAVINPVETASSSGIVNNSSKSVKLRLPTSPFLTSSVNCVPGDVVAISGQGSLIRNNEVGLYSLFGDETLIGYAIDGWPIYGVTERQLDECGGAFVAGEYRYFLSDDRENILNCFVSLPANL